ncbi:tlc domain protein [Cystoisospora suis]|uniref:Tlc domain protein n=1 Tax=Cystoisospora suis TaxID=483139 RepID=A0A2C6L568_9APIC|nr:tlc domain protein [Cystoisospora suis]
MLPLCSSPLSFLPSIGVAEDGGFVQNALGTNSQISCLVAFIFLTALWFLVHAFVSPVLPGLLLPPSARRLHREKEQRLLELEQLEEHSGRKDGDTHKEELKELHAYFVTANANATASLHALYLVPAALFHALSTVIFPSAQLVVAQAAAAASKRALASGGDAGEGSELLTANAAISAADSKRRNIWDTYVAHWDEAPDFWDGENNPVVILSAYIMASYFFWDSIECFRNLQIHRRAFLIHGIISFLAAAVEILAPGIKLAGACGSPSGLR